ncbi:MAG: ribonuclease III [Saprospiraceae bacterium]|nr:ribonuclease III [Saprospiraceae bacterium]
MLIRKIYNYYFSKDKRLARQLKQVLGYVPSRMHLYKLAFYHKSMNNNNNKNQHNERLEYLGDSLLSSIVAEYLFKKYPQGDEGFLTKMRSKIVKRKTLNKIAKFMGIDVILSEYSQGRISNSMLGNALEAVVGAIYLERGYDKTKNYVIKKILLRYLDVHELEETDDNFKSQLLEWGQKNNILVDFKLVSKYKYEKRDRFKVGVVIDGEEISVADDFNKKAAEQSAAQRAMTKMKLN